MASWIDGVIVEHDVALRAAATLLVGARLPAITGLVADVDDIRAALRLAESIGAMVDPLASPQLYAALGALAATGTIATTANEAVARADFVLAVGEVAGRAPLLRRMAGSSPVTGRTAGCARTIVALGGSSPGDIEHLRFPLNQGGVAATIGLLRAIVSGRLSGEASLAGLPEKLRGARFGVVLYQPEELGELAVQMLTELLQELNDTARCFALPLSDEWQGQSVLQVSAWTTGRGPRVGFGRGFAEHDPWRFDARRAAAAGEIEAVLWLAPLPAPPQPFGSDLPVVAMVGGATGREGRVVMEVAIPGTDRDGSLWDERRGAIGFQKAERPGDAVVAARALAQLEREVLRLRHASC
jgi:formylmethanofuran dehydrogenase subunit B